MVVLDVRPREDYAAGHISGAQSLPFDERPIIAYCRGAYWVLAHDAVRLLGGEGIEVLRLEDGMLEWHMIAALRLWPTRRWTAALSGAVVVLLIAVSTDLIDTPIFRREVPRTCWVWPSLLLSSALTGLLVASDVASPERTPTDRAATRSGWAGTALIFFAVGCPVCNKFVLLALGTAGAMTWFEPLQPLLQVTAVALLAWALRKRLLGELSCPTNPEEVDAESRASTKSPLCPDPGGGGSHATPGNPSSTSRRRRQH